MDKEQLERQTKIEASTQRHIAKTNKIPENIVGFIRTLENQNAPKWNREISCQILERIVEASQTAIDKYYGNVQPKRSKRA